MKILVFGIGGVGGLVGGALANFYDETYFYARNKTKEIIAERGLRLDSVKIGNLVVKPKIVSDDPSVLGKMDVVFLSCKADKLQAACNDLAPLIQESTIVIPLMNGILASELLVNWLPPCIIADGTIRTFSHIESPGHVVQDGGMCDISFGMKNGQNSDIFNTIAEIMTKAGIKTEVVDNIVQKSWQKFAITGTMSAILCYFNGNVGFSREQVNSREIIEGAYAEVQTVAKAYQVDLSDRFIESLINNFYTTSGDTITSLYRDLMNGKEPQDTELEVLVGTLITKGVAAGIDTPIFKAAYSRFAK